MKKFIYLIIITLLSVSLPAQAQVETQTDEDLVKKNSHYFEIVNDKASGSGFDILKNEIESSQFLFLGEEHFSARVSEFTNAIVTTLVENNFNYFAAEIGFNSAKKITDLIKQNKSLYNFNSEVYNLVGEVPVPFFDGKEDETFLKSFIENGFEIWGLDQEYLTSQVFLIDELYNLSNNQKQLNSYYKSANHFAVTETKKSRKDRKYKVFTSLLNSTEISQYFNKLDTTIPEIQKIISDLKKS
jgi:hypothetical protein